MEDLLANVQDIGFYPVLWTWLRQMKITHNMHIELYQNFKSYPLLTSLNRITSNSKT